MQSIQAWVSDRRSVLKTEQLKSRPDDLDEELLYLLQEFGIIARRGDSRHDWLASLEGIARQRGSACRNLLIQSNAQIGEVNDFEDWSRLMNERLCRFGIKIVGLSDGRLGLATC